MSEQLSWKKRQSITVTCPSGVTCIVRRPSPEIGLRGGKMMRVLAKLRGPDEKPEPLNVVLKRIEGLTDDEMAKLMVFAREVVMATVVRPKLVAKPSPGVEDEIGPDDIELSDFWYLFDLAMRGVPEIPVETKDGETTVEAVASFPGGTAPSDSSGEDRSAQS